MAGFKALNDACKNFEEELKRVNTQLFSAKISEPFEDCIDKKLRDYSLFTSKLRFLRAKTLALTQPPTQEPDEATIIDDYEEAVVQRLVDQQLAKSVTQAQAVQTLITTKDSCLDAEMIDRKRKIQDALSEYRLQESKLQHLDTVLKEREEALLGVRQQWEREVEAVRELRDQGEAGINMEDPNYKRLVGRVESLEMMRWLMSRLSMPVSRGYDWPRDPQRRLAAIKLARTPHTVHTFFEDS